MSKKDKIEPKVFISYSNSEEMDEYFKNIKESLEETKLLCEKLSLEHKGEIYDFAENKNEMNYFILLMNDSFFKSQNCMFELNELFRAKQFRNNCYPILIKDSNIFDGNKRNEYIEYWDNELRLLKDKVKSNEENEYKTLFDINKCSSNRILITYLFNFLKDVNTIKEDEERFSKILDALKKSLKTKIEIDSEILKTEKHGK